MEEENRPLRQRECCILWSTIPCLSWLCPFVGHIGVANSEGTTFDFQGSFTIGTGRMLFGRPQRKWKIDIDCETWDRAIEDVSNEFGNINYNILCSNCHYFAAAVLDKIGYKQIPPFFGKWVNGATIKIIWGLILNGQTLTVPDYFKIWLPFVIFWLIIFIIFIK